MAKRALESAVQRRRFTVDEYHRMGEAGVFGPEDRVELLDGEVIEMSPIGSEHAGCVNALSSIFSERLRRRTIVAVQNPFLLSNYSEPEPDLCLLRPRADFYRRSHPQPGDVLLVVEVASSSLGYDRGRKRPAYASAGVPELWIVDLAGEAVLVHRRPSGRTYRLSARYRRGANVAPQAFPDCRIAVADILG
ncbi:MAG: Uma2 family endonuclease [Deltaproteobacteria bacterium]|nr:Uma2 family endonuclease [Deltaproteobacteria bacterium]